jgi:hypothetical protein
MRPSVPLLDPRRERVAVDGEVMGDEQLRRQMIVGIDPAARDIGILNALFR